MDFMHCAFFGITTKAWWGQRFFEIGFQLKLGSVAGRVIHANGSTANHFPVQITGISLFSNSTLPVIIY